VRLEVGNQPVGVLFVNWRKLHHWSENEKQAVQLFANQAAIAIGNMQQYNALEKNRQKQIALHKAGKTIAKAGLEIEAVLQAILAQAIGVTGAPFGTLQLVEGNHLNFVASWPIEICDLLKEELGEMPINGPGITARAIRENDAQLVPDVTTDPDFVDATSQTGSELAVVLRQDKKPIGILNLEHREVGGFDEEDRQLLISLSNLAVVALQNAEQYEELERLRDHLLTSEAVAWLGLLGAEWKHAINQKTFSIANYVNGLRRSLKNKPPCPLVGEVLKTLERIEKITENIRGMQFINQMPSKLSQVSGQTMIDDELYRFVESRCRSRADVKTVFKLNCPAIAVRIEPQWLRVAMEKLVGNALKAMLNGGTLTIATELVDEQVHITIKDTGGGIPEPVLPDFLKRPIPERKEESGTGMGAIISQFIAINHHGELILVKSLPHEGTELCLRLPIA
jgi:signal transduction histidine kinase